MKNKGVLRGMAGLLLLTMLLLVVAFPAMAFEGRSSENLVIEEGEVVQDDLYASGNTVQVKGTIKGDLFAVGSLVIIDESGLVEGDVVAAGQGVVINGTVKDDARIAGAVLSVGENARIGSDLVAFGYSLAVATGAEVGQDLIYYGGQGLLSGAIGRNAKIGTGGFQLDGKIGGNMDVEVGGAEDVPPFSPLTFMPAVPGMPQAPIVSGGLTIGKEAQIGGSLNYTAPVESVIPEGVVSGQVSHKLPPPPTTTEAEKPRKPTAADKFVTWFLKFLRNLVTLFLVGLLLIYITPKLLDEGTAVIQSKPWHSILWGIVAYFVFIFAIFVVSVVAVLVVVILGAVTLGELMKTALGLGVVAVTGVMVAFNVVVSYLSKILVSFLVGKLIFTRLAPERAENRILPLLIGVFIVALLASIPVLGIIVTIVVVLLGLGALWLLGREWWDKRTAVAEVPAPAPAD